MDVSTLAVALGYTKKQVEQAKREGFKIQVERDRSILETVGEEKILYLLPKVSSNLSNDDGYDEFVYANNKWEWVGKTDVDLDYLQLNNKPFIQGRMGLSGWVKTPIAGTILLNTEDFKVFYSMYPPDRLRDEFKINLSPNVPINYMQTNNSWGEYDFNSLKGIFINSGTFRIPVTDLINKPSELNDLIGNVFITHYFQDCEYRDTISLIRVAMGKDINDNNLCFWQITEITNIGSNQYNVSNSSLWQELTSGGSQIVSGVVNANGTITFTDSDGNTFTTTGSSVIGPQGDDYVLTAQDKSDIADIVLSELPTTQGVLYGNTSN